MSAETNMAGAARRVAERLEGTQPDDRYLDTVRTRVGRKVEGLAAVEQEILREAAASLGRQGARVERALATLRELELAFAEAPSEALAERHEAERVEAERALWHLRIQREALGMRNHRELERRYPVPRQLRPPR
jgi:hypothetical protein